MSVYQQIRTELRNKVSLIAAIKALGYEFAEGRTQLRDYYNDLTNEYADVVIKRGTKVNGHGFTRADLGFAWNEAEGRFELHYDHMDADEALRRQIIGQYALEEIRRVMPAGYSFHVVRDAQNELEVVIDGFADLQTMATQDVSGQDIQIQL